MLLELANAGVIIFNACVPNKRTKTGNHRAGITDVQSGHYHYVIRTIINSEVPGKTDITYNSLLTQHPLTGNRSLPERIHTPFPDPIVNGNQQVLSDSAKPLTDKSGESRSAGGHFSYLNYAKKGINTSITRRSITFVIGHVELSWRSCSTC